MTDTEQILSFAFTMCDPISQGQNQECVLDLSSHLVGVVATIVITINIIIIISTCNEYKRQTVS